MDYLSRAIGGTRAAHPHQWWRVTTATRVFALAAATGLALIDQSIIATAPLAATLALAVTISSALEWGSTGKLLLWVPAGEALLVALILTNARADGGLYAYLAAPPIVAGIRYGAVNTLNTTLVGGSTVAFMLVLVRPDERPVVGEVASWILVGLGAGMLASWQSRSNRELGERLAPYAAAHHLMTQLHGLAREGAVGLDSTSLATELEGAMRSATGATRTAVFVSAPDNQPVLLAQFGDGHALQEHVGVPVHELPPDVVVVTLTGAARVLGHCVLGGVGSVSEDVRLRTQEVANAYALRLDTALLFEGVRQLATSEERNRIAREMHDGVAQEIVALGYVVDEIESVAGDPDVRALASGLREEISRVVTELRYSIFDLRHHVVDEKLSGALAEYAQRVSRDTDIRVHLTLDNSGPELSPRAQAELLRIAQEAIGNARQHARASNLWVTYVHDTDELRLEVADDGVGGARPRERHWGLHTMRERATGLGAEFTVEPRADGGTVVRLVSRYSNPSEGNRSREHGSSTR